MWKLKMVFKIEVVMVKDESGVEFVIVKWVGGKMILILKVDGGFDCWLVDNFIEIY